jgi:hypothetical protein
MSFILERMSEKHPRLNNYGLSIVLSSKKVFSGGCAW